MVGVSGVFDGAIVWSCIPYQRLSMNIYYFGNDFFHAHECSFHRLARKRIRPRQAPPIYWIWCYHTLMRGGLGNALPEDCSTRPELEIKTSDGVSGDFISLKLFDLWTCSEIIVEPDLHATSRTINNGKVSRVSTAASRRGNVGSSQHSAEFLLVGPELISSPGPLLQGYCCLLLLSIHRNLAIGAETNAISLLLMAWPVRCQCPASRAFTLVSSHGIYLLSLLAHFPRTPFLIRDILHIRFSCTYFIPVQRVGTEGSTTAQKCVSHSLLPLFCSLCLYAVLPSLPPIMNSSNVKAVPLLKPNAPRIPMAALISFAATVKASTHRLTSVAREPAAT